MDDVAETVISHLRLDDAPSLFQLRVVGLDYAHPQYGPHRKQFCDVLKVTAPLDAGRRIFKYKMGRQTIPFDKDDWEGAVAFTDGFTSDSCRANRIALYKLGSTKAWPAGIRVGAMMKAKRHASQFSEAHARRCSPSEPRR